MKHIQMFYYRDRDENGYELVEFKESITAKNFIKDFSIESANLWCKEQKIKF